MFSGNASVDNELSSSSPETYDSYQIHHPDLKDSHLPYLERGRRRIVQAKYQAAIEDLSTALQRLDDSATADKPQCYGLLGMARLFASIRTQDYAGYNAAIQDLTTALRLDAKAHSPVFYLGRCYAYLHKFDFSRAVSDLNLAIALQVDVKSKLFHDTLDHLLKNFLCHSAELVFRHDCPVSIVERVKDHLIMISTQSTEPSFYARFFRSSHLDIDEIEISRLYLFLIVDEEEAACLQENDAPIKTYILNHATTNDADAKCIAMSGYAWEIVNFKESACINPRNANAAIRYYTFALANAGTDRDIIDTFILRGIAHMKSATIDAAEHDFTRALELLTPAQHHLRALCFANRGYVTRSIEDLTQAIEIGSVYISADEVAVMYCLRARFIMGDISQDLDDDNHSRDEIQSLQEASRDIIAAGKISLDIMPVVRKELRRLFDLNFCLASECVLRSDCAPALRNIIQELLIKACSDTSCRATIELHQFYLRLCIEWETVFAQSHDAEETIMDAARYHSLSPEALEMMNTYLASERYMQLSITINFI